MIQYMDNEKKLNFENVGEMPQIKEKYCFCDPWDFYYEKGIASADELEKNKNSVRHQHDGYNLILTLDHSTNNSNNNNIKENNDEEYNCIRSSNSFTSTSPLVISSDVSLFRPIAVDDASNSSQMTLVKEEEVCILAHKYMTTRHVNLGGWPNNNVCIGTKMSI